MPKSRNLRQKQSGPRRNPEAAESYFSLACVRAIQDVQRPDINTASSAPCFKCQDKAREVLDVDEARTIKVRVLRPCLKRQHKRRVVLDVDKA
jgi:hypothetical protein